MGGGVNPNKNANAFYYLKYNGIIQDDGYFYEIVEPVKKILDEIYQITSEYEEEIVESIVTKSKEAIDNKKGKPNPFREKSFEEYKIFVENKIKPQMEKDGLDLEKAPTIKYVREFWPGLHNAIITHKYLKEQGIETWNQFWKELGFKTRDRGKRGEYKYKRKHVNPKHEIMILKLIKESWSITQQKISDNLGISRTAVSEILTLLEEQGKIEKKGYKKYEVVEEST
jgi:biotin operon repressor